MFIYSPNVSFWGFKQTFSGCQGICAKIFVSDDSLLHVYSDNCCFVTVKNLRLSPRIVLVSVQKEMESDTNVRATNGGRPPNHQLNKPSRAFPRFTSETCPLFLSNHRGKTPKLLHASCLFYRIYNWASGMFESAIPFFLLNSAHKMRVPPEPITFFSRGYP